MDRIQMIFEHPLSRENFLGIQEAEKNRKYCRHDLAHFLDVARICYIFSLENGNVIEKSIIYAAALLHDIGRLKQINENIPHDIAGAKLAEAILKDTGFDESERSMVTEAILHHRKNIRESCHRADELSYYLYKADKLSRQCFCCQASDECKWDSDKKNRIIYI